MKKFRAVYKEKQALSKSLNEQHILTGFKGIYNALLEKYQVTNYKTLSPEYQNVFLAELNSFWDEKIGLLERGKSFLTGYSDILNESSTVEQKITYIKKRSIPVITETFRQSGLKYRLYDIIDKVYKETNASNLREVMSAKELTNLMVESFKESVKEIMTEIKYELHESTIESKKKEFSSKKEGDNKKVNEGLLKKKKANIQKQVITGLLKWLKDSDIKAKADSKGFIRDKNYNILVSVTPIGYVDISGIGNYSPEELKDNKEEIISGMKGLLGGGYN